MHFHCEVYAPEVPADIETYVAEAMAPYSQVDWDYEEEDCEEAERDCFWDWYVIGGRWSGQHSLSMLNEEKLENFYGLMKSLKDEQSIDLLFDLYFPEYGYPCPFTRNAYDGLYEDDIWPLEQIPGNYKCYTLVVPGLGAWHMEEWDEEARKFRPTEFAGLVVPFLKEKLGITTGYLITVDYHS